METAHDPDGLGMDTQGNLYGATEGGSAACSAPRGSGALVTGCGTVFKLALPASIATTTTTLHLFAESLCSPGRA